MNLFERVVSGGGSISQSAVQEPCVDVRGPGVLTERIKEVDKNGNITAGVFLPIPKRIAKYFPDKSEEDDSVPHITLLYVGDINAEQQRKLVYRLKRVMRYVRPFRVDMHDYDEFANSEGKKIAHMVPTASHPHGLAALHVALWRAAEDAGIPVAHSYGKYESGKPDAAAFKSHAILAYLDADQDYDGPVPTGSWDVDELEVWGHEKVQIPLARALDENDSGARHLEEMAAIDFSKSVKPRRVGVLVVTPDAKNPDPLFAMFGEKAFDAFKKRAERYVRTFKRPIRLYLLSTTAHAHTKVKRKPPKVGLDLFALKGRVADALDLSPKNLVYEVSYNPKPATEDRLPGGRGDKLKASDVDPEQLAMGIEVELEHTKDRKLAREIALDHLAEDPKYYTKLKKIDPHHEVVDFPSKYNAPISPSNRTGAGTAPQVDPRPEAERRANVKRRRLKTLVPKKVVVAR